MSKNNEIKVIDKKSSAMTVKRGDKSIEFSPELSQQICKEMISLGNQLISETGRVTVEYFKTQANMYYGQLNAYIENQTLKSNERMRMLKMIENLTDKYSSLINETDDVEKQKQLKAAYSFLVDKQTSLYTSALKAGGNSKSPKKPDLLSGIKRLFSRK